MGHLQGLLLGGLHGIRGGGGERGFRERLFKLGRNHLELETLEQEKWGGVLLVCQKNATRTRMYKGTTSVAFTVRGPPSRLSALSAEFSPRAHAALPRAGGPGGRHLLPVTHTRAKESVLTEVLGAQIPRVKGLPEHPKPGA